MHYNNYTTLSDGLNRQKNVFEFNQINKHTYTRNAKYARLLYT